MSEHRESDLPAFGQYLLAEYSHVANAHFKMIDTISTFFGHYLLVMAIPISALGLLLPGRLMGDQPIEFTKIIAPYRFLLCVAFSIVAVAGLGMLVYIVNLRLDALLYARTINGIRKYFYDEGTIDIDAKLRMRGLPQSPQLPSFHEPRYFFPVVLAFTIVDASYLGLGLWIAEVNPWLVLSVSAIFFSLHFVLYRHYAYYREHRYLRSNIIGVDIDGVLNEHGSQFCRLLKEHTGIDIKPDQITVIPVHECEGLGVTREDEKKAFNDPNYWKDMPEALRAARNLKRIRNSFNMKIYIFTHRPWPMTEGMDDRCRHKVIATWRKAVSLFHREEGIAPFDYTDVIKDITELWLRKHGFEYDWLMVEKGSDEVSDPHAQISNRFYKSREMRIRFFVEDDARKAKKLAYTCDVVFLLEQPYNLGVPELPSNVIRVKSWDEIYKNVRALS